MKSRSISDSLSLLILISTMLLSWSMPGHAHDARPLSITMLEQTSGVYRVVLRAPPTLPAQNAPTLLWPADCDTLESSALPFSPGSTSLVSCEGGLTEAILGLDYPQGNPSLTTLIRLQRADGHAITAVLPPDELSWAVPADPDLVAVARQYTLFGFEHIVEGLDHLLFVAGLLLLARGPRRIVLAVTGFTIAHSITLGLATFELVMLPVALVESLIALSVVFLAVEIIRNDRQTLGQRFPVVLSFVFGLLHGFGFASALGEISLPTRDIVNALLFFNIGVELGQLAFITVCLLLWTAIVSWGRHFTRSGLIAQQKALSGAGAYCIGIPAAFWFAERSHALLWPA